MKEIVDKYLNESVDEEKKKERESAHGYQYNSRFVALSQKKSRGNYSWPVYLSAI